MSLSDVGMTIVMNHGSMFYARSWACIGDPKAHISISFPQIDASLARPCQTFALESWLRNVFGASGGIAKWS